MNTEPEMSSSPDISSATWPRYALFLALILPSLVTWLYFHWLHGSSPLTQQFAYGIGKSLQFGLPLFLAWRGQGGGWEQPKPRGAGLVIGAAFGLTVCLLLVGAFFWLVAGTPLEQTLLTTASAKLASLGLNRVTEFLAVGLFYSAVHSLLEEYYWRWFVFGRGRLVWGQAPAMVISSLGFMAHHVLLLGHFLGYAEWRTYLFAGSIAVGGMFWAWLYQKTDNLTASWLSHAIVDAGIFGFGYWLLFA